MLFEEQKTDAQALNAADIESQMRQFVVRLGEIKSDPVWMNDNVLEAGVRICKRFNVGFRQWAGWMHNTSLHDEGGRVLIYFSCRFRKDEAERRLGRQIGMYFNKPVAYEMGGLPR